jgi:predicted  nucleic acid-binding Zn-ribbon protein
MSQVVQALEQLAALTAIDVALDGLAAREAAARARAEEAKRDLERFRERIKAEKRQLDDVLKERKAIELDVKQREEQIKKYSAQMYEVKTNKEYAALKDEIEKARATNQAQEDRLLQLMIREDELRSAAARRQEDLARAEAEAKRVAEETETELAACAAERAELDARRVGQVAAMPPDLIRRYDAIRRARGGSTVSRVLVKPGDQLLCAECHMVIRPQLVVEIHKQEELVACESCGRILLLEPVSGGAS